jgi:hypothetical protein
VHFKAFPTLSPKRGSALVQFATWRSRTSFEAGPKDRAVFSNRRCFPARRVWPRRSVLIHRLLCPGCGFPAYEISAPPWQVLWQGESDLRFASRRQKPDPNALSPRVNQGFVFVPAMHSAFFMPKKDGSESLQIYPHLSASFVQLSCAACKFGSECASNSRCQAQVQLRCCASVAFFIDRPSHPDARRVPRLSGPRLAGSSLTEVVSEGRQVYE